MVNNIKELHGKNLRMEDFISGYFDYLYDLLMQLDVKKIKAFMDEMEASREEGNTVFVAGNGGSAATASHFANDFGGVAFNNGEVDAPFRVHALTDNISLMTAIANDNGYINLFVHQLRIHYRRGDKLVLISASGNSENLTASAEWVKARGGTVIALVGFNGGRLAEISDVVIHVKTPKGEYGPVEDVHMIMDHLLSTWMQRNRYTK